MKNSLIVLATFVSQLLFSQQNETIFDVHQMLYYENEDCHDENRLNKYAVIYQNLDDSSKFAVNYLNSFNDEVTAFYLVNQYKLIYAENYFLKEYNIAKTIQINIDYLKDIDDLAGFEQSKIKYKFLEKENLVRDNRMLTAYHFKVSNFEKVTKIVYYIDHASSGVPFSFHESFFDEMRKEGFPLFGNVIQRDEINRNGSRCTYTLKSINKPNKRFVLLFE